MAVLITTDSEWKEFKSLFDVPYSVVLDHKYLTAPQLLVGWFKFDKRWYNLADFKPIRNQSESYKDWDLGKKIITKEFYEGGYKISSEYATILIKLDINGKYIVGKATW